nr:RecName: Full=C-hordein [Hordeum vulgare subsp. spontaneum]
RQLNPSSQELQSPQQSYLQQPYPQNPYL